MISFIIIGKNEGDKLIKCFQSVKSFTRQSTLESEIIYVDSQSTDGSFENALQDPEIKSFKLNGKCSPSIARNYGAKMAKGDFFCFIDGDMELIPNKLEFFFTDDGKLLHPIMTANRIDMFYDSEGNYIGNNEKEKINLTDKFEITSGGLMLINKSLWNSVSGMDEFLKFFEDNDLVYRIYVKHKIKVLKSKVILVKHHTTRYTDKDRYKSFIFSDSFLYKGKLYRKYFFNPKIFFRLLRSDLTIVSLVFSILLMFFFKNAFFISIYFFVSFIKLFFISRVDNDIPVYKRYFMDMIKDIKIIAGFFKK